MSEDKTYFDTIVDKFKNNKFFAILLVVLIAYFGITKLVKETHGTIEIVQPNSVSTTTPPSTTLAKKIFTLKGKIHNDTDQPLDNVKVNIVDAPMISDLTDSEGFFILEIPLEKVKSVFSITATKNGFKTWNKKIIKAERLEIDLNKIILEKEAIKPKKTQPKNPTAKTNNKEKTDGPTTNINNTGTIGNVITAEEITININEEAKDTSNEKQQ